MLEIDDDFEFEAVVWPSKAAERRSWKEQAKADLEELADLYPEYADVLSEVQL